MVANTDSLPGLRSGKSSVLIVGAGPAGLIAAERMAVHGIKAVVVDASPAPARKFLIAGRGGLNLTHAGTVDQFLPPYGSEQNWLRPFLQAFDGTALRDWADGLGAETFVGTSGRIFPKALKSTDLLRAWLARLARLGVNLKLRTRLVGIEPSGAVRLRDAEGEHVLRFDACILALGGASWPRLGSDGAWRGLLAGLGIEVRDFEPANIGMIVPWSDVARTRLEGQPLKNLAGSAGPAQAKGEIQLTAYGIEGQLVYALGRALRTQLHREGEALLQLDLKPDLDLHAILDRLERPRGSMSWSTWLTKRLKLPPSVPTLLREAGVTPQSDVSDLAAAIKSLPIRIVGTRPIAEAISTAGGVALHEVDERLMLRKCPGLFLAGEMLDWEAPTGGYLLQACFSTGVAAADGVAAWLTERAGSCPRAPNSP